MAHVFTVKSNANRKIRATIEQYPDLKAEDFTVEPAEGGFVVRMTVRNAADQEVALNRSFEFAVPGIETLPPAAGPQVPDIVGYLSAGLPAEPEVFPTRGKAQVAAFERGLGVFTVRKAEGGYVIDENAKPEDFKREPAPKARKAKAEKAAPAPKAPKAAKPAKAAAGPGKWTRGVFLREAAERGELPPVPDFSADLHKRNRGRLAQLVAMAEAGDVAGLEAFPIKPNCTSPKAMDRYRNLCVIALKACAAKPTA